MFSNLLNKIGWSDVPSSFGFHVKEFRQRNGIWSLHSGINKATSQPVSIFVYQKSQRSANPIDDQLAARAFRKWKSIRHPSFLAALEVASTSTATYIATESVTPLTDVAQDVSQKELLAAGLPWNLRVVAAGLQFLHSTAAARHGSMGPDSIMVTARGEWRIGGFERCVDRDEALAEFASTDRSPYAMDRADYAALAAWACSIRAGVTVVSHVSEFESNMKFAPPALGRICKRLKDPATASIEVFDWEGMLTKSPYFADSALVQAMLVFTNIALKGNWDKEIFFQQTLPDLLTAKIPAIAQTYIILPHVVTQLQGTATATFLKPSLLSLFLRIIAKIEDSAFFGEAAAGPFIQLMKSPERATRYAMLQNLECYEKHLTSAICKQLFDSLCIGLEDATPELREITLRSMLTFVPLVTGSKSQLQKGLQLMAECAQHDQSEAIRTNAAVCFAKLISSLDATVVKTSIAPNFIPILRDTFGPCRLAALQGLALAAPLLSCSDVAIRYLPALCPCLTDPDLQCRTLAFSTVETFIKTLRQSQLPGGLSAENTGPTPVAFKSNFPMSQQFGGAMAVPPAPARSPIPGDDFHDCAEEPSSTAVYIPATAAGSTRPGGRLGDKEDDEYLEAAFGVTTDACIHGAITGKVADDDLIAAIVEQGLTDPDSTTVGTARLGAPSSAKRGWPATTISSPTRPGGTPPAAGGIGGEASTLGYSRNGSGITLQQDHNASCSAAAGATPRAGAFRNSVGTTAFSLGAGPTGLKSLSGKKPAAEDSFWDSFNAPHGGGSGAGGGTVERKSLSLLRVKAKERSVATAPSTGTPPRDSY